MPPVGDLTDWRLIPSELEWKEPALSAGRSVVQHPDVITLQTATGGAADGWKHSSQHPFQRFVAVRCLKTRVSGHTLS